MIAQLLKMPPAFVVPVQESGEPYISLASSEDFLEARKKTLEECINQDRLSLYKADGTSVSFGVAEEHFQDFIFPGFDDGFLAAYRYKSDAKSPCDEDGACHFYGFYEIQVAEIRNFVLRFQRYVQKKTIHEIKYEDALKFFLNAYFKGFAIGFRAGFCGLACFKNEGCPSGDLYRRDEITEEGLKNDFY